ncbi:MAG: undecaprenyl-diphosphate phosphatase [Candidatus Staskawiczbacteria bacterium]|nr:undecaprenyl-diphosphate phosphatase [Candidatus Staskawiczbacteria bacterium]
MLSYITATILGIVEGFTEFLPISSTGHLILVNQWITFDKEFTLLFDIVIQLGAILAVVVFFFKKLWPFTSDKVKNKDTWTIWFKTLVGVSPAIVLGFLFASKIEELLFNPWAVAITLLVGGIIILLVEARQKHTTNMPMQITSIKDLSYKTAFFVGLVQCLSMVPGVSRSGATIIGGMIFGASRVVATEFSFFLAVPTMVAATAWSLLKYRTILDINQFLVLAIGFIVSFVVALVVIKFLINYVQKNNFKIFGWYRIILGIIIIAYFLIK